MNAQTPDPSLEKLEDKIGEALLNRRLRSWISDDRQRGMLLDLIDKEKGGELEIPSRDTGYRDSDSWGLEQPRPLLDPLHKKITLVTHRDKIEQILGDRKNYSNRIYAELGGGNFMLALDPEFGTAHKAQREAYCSSFRTDDKTLRDLSRCACEAAAIMSLRAPEFDLAQFAEQAALRFSQKLLGYALADFRLLESALRAGYRALVYQVLGRHFATDPTTIPLAKAAMAQLLKRTSDLIDAYAVDDEDELKGTDDRAVPTGHKRVLPRLAKLESNLNGEQRAILAVGAAFGTVGNVQAAACIVVKSLFATPTLFEIAQNLAQLEPTETSGQYEKQWRFLVEQALRENPPIAFLPRLEVDLHGVAIKEYLLALGGGTRGGKCKQEEDPLIWGLPGGAPHWCVGRKMAWPLIIEIVRHVMGLPALEERLDAEDASVIGLKKRWGFACESYPLTHQRDRRVAQASLNVAMRIRPPVKDNADRLREVIRSGAPRIEEALREARHVHFAWFELIESDTVLVLHTVYDGPFSAYIQHFALRVGDVFDSLFECIENPPPTPVDKFPNEFVAHIQRYDRAPAMGYFFSAYPNSEVARILRSEDDARQP